MLYTELKVDLNAYLASTDPAKVKTRTLEDLIAFNKATPKEMEWFGQESFEKAQATKGYDDPEYIKAVADGKRLAGPEGIDEIPKDTGAVAIVAPDHRSGLDHRPAERRPLRRLVHHPARRGRLSAPDRADGRRRRPAGGAQLHRPGLERGALAEPGLRLRAGDDEAQGAEVPEDGGAGEVSGDRHAPPGLT